MEVKILNEYIKKGSLIKKSPDIHMAASLIDVALITAKTAMNIPLKEGNAIVIFRELYESLRQLGDAKLWKMGYEARQHEPSIKILTYSIISNPLALNRLDRFRLIRNDANYRGYKITLSQANDIVEFWTKYGEEIIKW